MSIAKYIEEFNQRRNERIKKNQEYIDAYPYPIDELNSLDPNSSLTKLYNENGEIPNASQFRTAAASENPDLYRRLNKGNSTLRKIKQNEELNSIDPLESLNRRYEETIKGIAVTGLTFNKLINSDDPSEFEEAYDSIMNDAGISGIDASPSTVMSAFKELNNGSTDGGAINDNTNIITDEKESSVLNDDEVNETNNEGSKLGSEVEVESEPTSEVESNVPELEKEIKPLPDSTQESVSDSVTSPLNDNITNNNQNVTNEGSSSTINDTNNIININDSNESLNNDISNIGESKSINNDIESTNISTNNQSLNQEISPITNNDNILNNNESSDINNIDGDSNVESNSINTPKSKESSVKVVEDDFSVSADDLAVARQFLGTGSSSIINDESKNIDKSNTESTESTSVTSTNNFLEQNNMENKSNVESTEITKNKIGIDKKIAPINLPTQTEPKSIDKSESSDSPVNVTEVASESNVVAGGNTSTESSTIKNENKSSETNIGGDSNIDMSEVNERLRKIENLLSGPLEVKIVD